MQKRMVERTTLVGVPVPRPDSGKPPDPERRDRILGKLGEMWRRVPDWRLAWLIANLVPAGRKASVAEIESQLDRLLNLDVE
jgi:hypothetical protein